MRRLLLAALLLGCGDRGRGAAGGGTASAAVPAAAQAATQTAAQAAAQAAVDAGPAPTFEPDDPALRVSPILRVSAARPPRPRGALAGLLGTAQGERAVLLEPASELDPVAYRRPLAFLRTAHALGARVAPGAALRHVGVGELAAAAEGSAEATAVVRAARVLNDGTVDVLVTDLPPEAASIDLVEGREARTWDAWAGSPVPLPGEDAGLLRDWVEAQLLDYLTATVARRTALLARGERRALILADNTAAFAPRPDGATLDKMLRRLRAVERWPRGTRAALLGFDRERARAALAGGSFSTWLLSPRALIELDERRATLATLLDAKVGARGLAAVECL